MGTIIGYIVIGLLGGAIAKAIMPGEQGYLAWKWVVNGKEIPYGLFIGEIVNFLIIALALYIFIVKFIGMIAKSKEDEVTQPAPLTKDQELLTEIRELLKKSETGFTFVIF